MFVGIQKHLVPNKVKFTTSGTQLKTMRPERKQENTVHNKEKNWSIESDAELTEMLGLPVNGIKTVIIFIQDLPVKFVNWLQRCC